MDSPIDNARVHPRVDIDAFVRVVEGDREYVFRTRDLSEGGLFLYTRVGHLYPFSIGSPVSIELHDFDHVVPLSGTIVRIVEPNSRESKTYPVGFGVRLQITTDEQRAALKGLIERAREQPLY